MKKISIFALLVGSFIASHSLAFEAFVVKTIQIQGLQRISQGAVLNELGIKAGQRLEPEETGSMIHRLYQTGFFKEVALTKSADNVLVIHVTEKPSILALEINGVKEKEKINKILKDNDLAVGRLYDEAYLIQAKKDLEQHYLNKGRYGVKVESKVKEQDKQVSITLDIFEGDTARIHTVELVGNNAFSSKILLKQLHEAKTNWLSWFTKDNQYSKEKLAADLDILRSYYMDKGYINFQIESTQVSLSPDKKDLFVRIHLAEGPCFEMGNVALAGEFVVPKKELEPLLLVLKKNKVFSRKSVIEVQEALKEHMGNVGYGFAEVRLNHEMDANLKKVNITYFLEPGKRVYVRRIHIKGNHDTRDEVLRRELPQMEGAPISTRLIKTGKRNIVRRIFASNVEVETPRVANSADEVDINYTVEEARAGRIMASVGFSPSEKLIFNFTVSQQNFLGTGKLVDFSFDKSRSYRSYSVGYQDPYFTVDGIGFGTNLFLAEANPSKATHVSTYTKDSYGGDLNWVFPMSQNDSIKFGVGHIQTHLKVGPVVSTQIKKFITDKGNRLRENSVVLGWGHDSLDHGIFPTVGNQQNFGIKLVVPGDKLQYYTLNYDAAWFYPLGGSWIANLSSVMVYGVGYGKTRNIPFYNNVYAGGAMARGKVRGFEENSLGPRDSTGENYGGNALVSGTASLIVPNPLFPDSKAVRTAVFMDLGQVYDTRHAAPNPRGIRSALGVAVTWNTPLGAPMILSLAKPIHAKETDQKQLFAFSFGTTF